MQRQSVRAAIYLFLTALMFGMGLKVAGASLSAPRFSSAASPLRKAHKVSRLSDSSEVAATPAHSLTRAVTTRSFASGDADFTLATIASEWNIPSRAFFGGSRSRLSAGAVGFLLAPGAPRAPPLPF